MSEKNNSTERAHANTQEREAERGDAAEPDAPTAGEENAGLSTILSADTPLGVQQNADEE